MPRRDVAARDLDDHSYVAYLVVEGVDAHYERVVAHDVEIVKPLRDGPWGIREFDVRTVDGHRVMLGSSLTPDA